MNIITILKALCWVGVVIMVVLLVPGIKKKNETPEGKAQWEKGKKFSVYNSVVMCVSLFCDSLGVGCYAIQSTMFKFKKSVDDINVPGTLAVANGIPVLAEAILYLGVVEIEPVTLVSLTVAVIVGGYLGANLVTKWNVQKVRKAMGIGLMVLALIMAMRQLHIGPFGVVGYATGVHGIKLVIAIVLCVFFGMLNNIGIGAYGPILGMVSLLGMSSKSAFPIMMCSCALMVPFGNGPVYIKQQKFDARVTVLSAIFGTIGVAVAILIVKSLPLDIVLWMVVCAVFISGIIFLKGSKESTDSKEKEVSEKAGKAITA